MRSRDRVAIAIVVIAASIASACDRTEGAAPGSAPAAPRPEPSPERVPDEDERTSERAPRPTMDALRAAWPEGVPALPGGEPISIGASGVIRSAVLAYESPPEAIEPLLRIELERAGWRVGEATTDEGVTRFTATRAAASDAERRAEQGAAPTAAGEQDAAAREVTLSIYREDDRTRVQAVELAL